MAQNLKTIDVTACARCGGDHAELTFMEFVRAFAPIEAKPVVWNYWSTCPNTKEPILMSAPVEYFRSVRISAESPK